MLFRSGDAVDIHNLVPTGTDPHEYEPLPDDIKKATDADVLFYNGLNLEGGKNGWFFKMVDSVGQDEDSVLDRKSTRLNSSHVAISYAVFCLKKKIKRIM